MKIYKNTDRVFSAELKNGTIIEIHKDTNKGYKVLTYDGSKIKQFKTREEALNYIKWLDGLIRIEIPVYYTIVDDVRVIDEDLIREEFENKLKEVKEKIKKWE